MAVLPDVLSRDLSVVFCGTAVGPTSARVGAYYAGPGNQFWDVLFRICLTPRRLEPHEFKSLLEHGIGLTDLAKKRSGTDEEIASSEFDVGALHSKIRSFAPKALAFNGKKAASAFYGYGVDYGHQTEPLGETAIFVLPSTSGAARGYWNESFWMEVAVFVGANGQRKDLPDTHSRSSQPVTSAGTRPRKRSAFRDEPGHSRPDVGSQTGVDRLIRRGLGVDALIIRYFQRTGEEIAKPKDLMPFLVRHGAFPKDHREGLPLRKLCRDLYAAGKLSVMTTVHFDQKSKNKSWYFLPTR